MPIYYHHGSVFDAGAPVIAHQVNCRGVMGSGVAAQVAKLYPSVYDDYKYFCRAEGADHLLGKCLMVEVPHQHIYIANLFGQYDFGRSRQHTSYADLRWALRSLHDQMVRKGITRVAIPYKMSCDRGGGDWSIVEKMIEEEFPDVSVQIYFIRKDEVAQ